MPKRKGKGFDNEKQRRAVMALLAQRLTGVKPSLGEKISGRVPGTARNKFRKTLKKKPAKAGRLLRQGREDLRSALMKDLRSRELRKHRAKQMILRQLKKEGKIE